MTNTSNGAPTREAPQRDTTPDDQQGGTQAMVARVADEAPAQAAKIVDDAKSQLRDATHRSLTDLRSQADDRTTQAVSGLRSLSSRAEAMQAGRLDEAGNLPEITGALGRYADEFANRLDTRGVDGLVDDVSRFGRQHPWAFLGLSVGVGFAFGRLVRTSAAVASDHASSNGSSKTGSPSIGPADGGSEGTGRIGQTADERFTAGATTSASPTSMVGQNAGEVRQ